MKLARQPHVVGIQQRNNFSVRLLEAEIERGSLSAIRLSQITDRITEFPQTLLGVVGRAVIYNQNLALLRGKLLRQNAGNCLLDVLPVVVSIDYDGEERRLHLCLPTII